MSWSGEVWPTGVRLTVVGIVQLTKKKQLTIPIPNATALMLDSSAKAYKLAQHIREKSGVDKTLNKQVSFLSDGEAIDYLGYMIESILLAFTAIEAFSNELIPDDYVHNGLDKDGSAFSLAEKNQIERKVSLDEKLSVILPTVLNCASPKGSKCWTGYVTLKRVRDRIVHMKTEDRRSGTAEVETVWKAILLTGQPQRLAKDLMEHFIKSMPSKPNWSLKLAERL